MPAPPTLSRDLRVANPLQLASAIDLQGMNMMLTRYMRAELCLVVHTAAVSCLSVVTIAIMRAAIEVAQVSPAVA